MRSLLKLSSIVFLLLGMHISKAQDTHRFANEVAELTAREYQFPEGEEVVMFVGSSSIRMWSDVQKYFPEQNIINNGFGGSTMSDLLFYYDKLILKFKPNKIFIYEGDNDVAGKTKNADIINSARELVAKIKTDLPNAEIIFISPKPSISRWEMAPEYIKLNKKLRKFCKRKGLGFANVWKAMMDENDVVLQDVFIEDNLHMNAKGYAIWKKVIDEYM